MKKKIIISAVLLSILLVTGIATFGFFAQRFESNASAVSAMKFDVTANMESFKTQNLTIAPGKTVSYDVVIDKKNTTLPMDYEVQVNGDGIFSSYEGIRLEVVDNNGDQPETIIKQGNKFIVQNPKNQQCKLKVNAIWVEGNSIIQNGQDKSNDLLWAEKHNNTGNITVTVVALQK